MLKQDIHAQRILILDFGSQYTQLIARRLREIGVYCELHPYNLSDDTLINFRPNGVILSGGPETVTESYTPRVSNKIFELGCPILGICYGMQTMAAQLGGEVIAANHREFGPIQLTVTQPHCRLFEHIEDHITDNGQALLDVWMSHSDQVNRVPAGFQIAAQSGNCEIAAMADDQRRYYGVQFHPEVTHTRQGMRILERFVKDICGCEGQWTTHNIIETQIQNVREKVGNSRVILGLSGGVDSAVVAALLHQSIPDQLICVFVDTGLLRYQERQQVEHLFRDHLGMKIQVVDAADRFLNALKGLADPEDKRKAIGRTFIEVFEQAAKQYDDVAWLAQGTIYPDVIESAHASPGQQAKVIKSHHNVGGLPERMHLKILEPLRELFKDEVRKIGLELGLPYDLVYRHPFPGPGLGVRVLGEIKAEYLDTLRHADHIFIEELRRNEWYDKIGQAFAVFLPVKSVGVMGDSRCYEYVIALRAVETIDFMTAKTVHLSPDLLNHVANRIMNEVRHVSRVVYDISSKPPATIEWE